MAFMFREAVQHQKIVKEKKNKMAKNTSRSRGADGPCEMPHGNISITCMMKNDFFHCFSLYTVVFIYWVLGGVESIYIFLTWDWRGLGGFRSCIFLMLHVKLLVTNSTLIRALNSMKSLMNVLGDASD